MEIDRYERIFLLATLVFLIGAAIALIVSVVGHHASLPTPSGRVAPEDVTSTPPFDDLGLHETGEGTYDLVMRAQAWQWVLDEEDPTVSEIRIPAGSEVTLIAASTDVVHGLKITETNANVMVIPGHISEVTIDFDDPGEYTMLCHEYCGIGHHNMAARIIVE